MAPIPQLERTDSLKTAPSPRPLPELPPPSAAKQTSSIPSTSHGRRARMPSRLEPVVEGDVRFLREVRQPPPGDSRGSTTNTSAIGGHQDRRRRAASPSLSKQRSLYFEQAFGSERSGENEGVDQGPRDRATVLAEVKTNVFVRARAFGELSHASFLCLFPFRHIVGDSTDRLAFWGEKGSRRNVLHDQPDATPVDAIQPSRVLDCSLLTTRRVPPHRRDTRAGLFGSRPHARKPLCRPGCDQQAQCCPASATSGRGAGRIIWKRFDQVCRRSRGVLGQGWTDGRR